jgi:hypothetical protein
MTSDYVAVERGRQDRWRTASPELPDEALSPGTFRGRSYPWLLPVGLAEHNLAAPVRAEVLAHFARHDIAWHDGETEDYGVRAAAGPSPNLMDSQVACLNFWWGLASASPDALLRVVRAFAPSAVQVVPPLPDGPLVEPEWIGLGNPLGERGVRRRGAYATSADALVVWVDPRGDRHGALVESKYTESYAPRDGRFSPRGTDRVAIYARAAAQPWSPLSGDVPLGDLMYEPFDQHARQQLLAAEMEAAGELGLRTVTLVHAAPRANGAFHEGITAPVLRSRGATVAEAWRSVLRRPERYVSVAYEDLFARASEVAGTEVWSGGLRARYGWAS